MQPCKLCPRCQTPHALDATQCSQCGHLFRTQFQNMDLDRTQVVTPPMAYPLPTPLYPPYPQQPVPSHPVYHPQAEIAPRMNYIVAMWALTGLAVLFASVSATAAILTDLPAFVLAIILVCSRSRVDRINGWIKLALEMLGVLLIFLVFLLGFLVAISGSPVSRSTEAPSSLPVRQAFTPQGCDYVRSNLSVAGKLKVIRSLCPAAEAPEGDPWRRTWRNVREGSRGDRTRTCDIMVPNHALYQLSYTPQSTRAMDLRIVNYMRRAVRSQGACVGG